MALILNPWTFIVTCIFITVFLQRIILPTCVYAYEFGDLLKSNWSTTLQKVSQPQIDTFIDDLLSLDQIYDEVKKILSTTEHEQIKTLLQLVENIIPPNITTKLLQK